MWGIKQLKPHGSKQILPPKQKPAPTDQERRRTDQNDFVHVTRGLKPSSIIPFKEKQKGQVVGFSAISSIWEWPMLLCLRLPLLMELNYEKLQSLIETAWALDHKLNSEIENTISFCRFCSDHGRFCHVSEAPFEERERLIAIRDSLKDVRNILLYIQRLRSWQEMDRRTAIHRLELSRLFLVKAVAHYRGRAVDVVKEVHAFGWNMKESAATETEDSVRNKGRRISSFMVCCIGILFNPSKWMNAAGFAVKLFVISATLSSTIHFRNAKQQSRKIVSIMDSTESGTTIDALLALSNSPLDLYCGRG